MTSTQPAAPLRLARLHLENWRSFRVLDVEIGSRLFLAEKTVKNYVSGILSKLGMQRRTQAAVLAAEWLPKDEQLR